MKFWPVLLPALFGCPQPGPLSEGGITITTTDASHTASSPPTDPSSTCIVNGVYHMPNPDWTPGDLCTGTNPFFDTWRYPAHLAHCSRHITTQKDLVARLYGIPKEDYGKYEFDHFIPLAAGGSNDPKNLWPQPIDDAKLKDVVEEEVYVGLKNGTMTQEQAVAKIRTWRSPACP